MRLRHTTFAVVISLALLPSAEAAAQSEGALAGKLRSAMRGAPASSGAYVRNADTGRAVFRFRQNRSRILASNTKLFTTAAALARFGVE